MPASPQPVEQEKMDVDDNPWKDYCAVEKIEEEEVRAWVCEIEEAEEHEEVELDESFGELDPQKVQEARAEELAYMRRRGLWRIVPIPSGVTPVSVRWVDVVKADGTTRSRLVARDFRGSDRQRDDLFAATPPLEAIRILISRATTISPSRAEKKLMFIDAKKAHLNPKCLDDVYVELPREAAAPPGTCGKLEFWLYGFRKAASEWEQFYSQKLGEVGFTRGVGCPVLFHHSERDVAMAVHGDDFVVCAAELDLRWVADYLKGCFEIKARAV